MEAELGREKKLQEAMLDDKLRILSDTGAEAVFTYFQPDEKKDGGAYVTICGTAKKIDPPERCVCLTDGVKLPIDDILDVEICAAGPISLSSWGGL